MKSIQEAAGLIRQGLKSAIQGQDEMIELLITGLLSGGHVLLEAVPGMGKTRAARALSRLISGEFRRLQFTPDLMPGDINGTVIYSFQSQHFEVVKGPVFTSILLADEINRAPAKTQSALLQAMEERKVSIAGTDHRLPPGFFVIATQNPLEMEGTYPLPEAQLDRFALKICMDYPDAESEQEIYRSHLSPADGEMEAILPVTSVDELAGLQLQLDTILIDDRIHRYTADLIARTRRFPGIAWGASPRAGLHLLKTARAWAVMQGRDYVIPEDIRDLGVPVLAHRLVLDAESEVEGISSEDIMRKILSEVVVFS